LIWNAPPSEKQVSSAVRTIKKPVKSRKYQKRLNRPAPGRDDHWELRSMMGLAMERLHFSPDDFAAARDDASRFAMWRDLFAARYGPKAITRDETMPFNARFEFLSLGNVGVGLMQGPFEKIMNAANRTDAFALAINKRSLPITYTSRGKEVTLEPRMATLIALGEPGGGCRHAALDNEWFSLTVERQPLLDAVANAEDQLARPIPRDNASLCYLRHYLTLLFNPNVEMLDEQLTAHIDRTIFDLIVLLLGASRDAQTIATLRGLRAVRLRAILAEINQGFSDPNFSARQVASRLGLSIRYVYELVYEAGNSFSERVLELRLQKARKELETPRSDSRKISDIAYAAGFNEVSHFNRCFRRRFGMTPTAARRLPDDA
jgi:AraC-like DNA-binding protein